MRRTAIITVAASLAGLAGCGSSPSEVEAGDPTTSTPAEAAAPSATSSPVVAGGTSTFGAGTPLGEGVEVVDGSALVGSVVPLVSENVSEEDRAANPGWQALLVIDGDPFEVWDAYAAALGLADVASAREACVVDGASRATKDQRFITEAAADGEQRLRCWVRADGSFMYLVVGSVACPSDADPCALPASHLYLARASTTSSNGIDGFVELGTSDLRFDRAAEQAAATDPAPDAGRGEPATGEPVVPTSATGGPPAGAPAIVLASTGSSSDRAGRVEEDLPEPVAIPEGPIQPPDLEPAPAPVFPGPGERMDAGLDDFLDGATAAVLPDGARSLVVPTMAIRCNSGLVTALDAPGSPVDVVQSFDPGMLDELVPPTTGTLDGRDWASFMYDEAGGLKLSMTAIDAGSGRSFVLVTECGD